MLRSLNDLDGYAIVAIDGPIGHVKDFYFDDEAWVIRYLVVDSGRWLSSRKVLILPIAIGQPNWSDKILPVLISKEQVKNSPDIDTDKPVSRQHEMQYLDYYEYPYYWGGDGLYGQGAYPGTTLVGLSSRGSDADYRKAQSEHELAPARSPRPEDGDPHLRSAQAITNYHIDATDGGIGHVQGLLVDEDTWAIRYLVVNTSNWWVGHQVLIVPRWIHDLSWFGAKVYVNLTRQAVKDAPSYDPSIPLVRNQEIRLHEHYGRPGYWADDAHRRMLKPISCGTPLPTV